MKTQVSTLGGYKLHVAFTVLGVSKQTLENWRKQLDPQDNRPVFSAPALLAYRIIKSLIKNRFMRVGDLKKIKISAISQIFKLCEDFTPETLEKFTLVIDFDAKTMFLTDDDYRHQLGDIDYIALNLDSVVQAHRDGFLRAGVEKASDAPPSDISAYRLPATPPPLKNARMQPWVGPPATRAKV